MQGLTCRHRPVADRPGFLLTRVDDLLDLFTLRVGQVQFAKRESSQRTTRPTGTSAPAARPAESIRPAAPALSRRRLILLLAR
jgi:hypothetical protein